MAPFETSGRRWWAAYAACSCLAMLSHYTAAFPLAGRLPLRLAACRWPVFGALAVAAVQGFMGGLMFWILGLPAPLLWGTVMAVLATMPMLGTFVVWGPAAVFLALQGHWGKAVVLTAWGGIAIALIDNLLYPMLVGTRLRLHPVLVFFSVVGGLFAFGAAGLIVGPMTLALAGALLEIWTRRTSFGQAADTEPRATG